MKLSVTLARGTAICALLALSATAASAEGKKDRAREAIAAASAKIDAANKVGASGEVPRLQAEAQAALRTAREDLARGHKEEAIGEANHASQLADTAIGLAERNHEDAARAQRDHAEAAAASAQRDAAAANARADSAEHAAADAAASADAARNTPPPAPVVIAAPAPPPPPPAPTTTVTVQRVVHRSAAPVRTSSVRRTRTTAVTHRRVVHHPAKQVAHRVTEKTTTTVTTTPNP
jgi:hypothetical protein